MKYSAYYVEEINGSFAASVKKLVLNRPENEFVQIKVSHS